MSTWSKPWTTGRLDVPGPLPTTTSDSPTLPFYRSLGHERHNSLYLFDCWCDHLDRVVWGFVLRVSWSPNKMGVILACFSPRDFFSIFLDRSKVRFKSFLYFLGSELPQIFILTRSRDQKGSSKSFMSFSVPTLWLWTP